MSKVSSIFILIALYASFIDLEGWSAKRIVNPGEIFFAVSSGALLSSTGLIDAAVEGKQYSMPLCNFSSAALGDSIFIASEYDGNLHLFLSGDTSSEELYSYMLPYSPSNLCIAGDILSAESPSGQMFYRIGAASLQKLYNRGIYHVDRLYKFGANSFCIGNNGSILRRIETSSDSLYAKDEFIVDRVKFLVSIDDTSYIAFSNKSGYIYYYISSEDSMYRKLAVYETRDFIYGEKADTFLVFCTQNNAYISTIPGTRTIEIKDSFGIDDTPRDIEMLGDTVAVVTRNSIFKYIDGNAFKTGLRRNVKGVEKYGSGFALITSDSIVCSEGDSLFGFKEIVNDLLFSGIVIGRDSSMHIISDDSIFEFHLPSMPLNAYSSADSVFYMDTQGSIRAFDKYGAFSPSVIAHSDYPLYSFIYKGTYFSAAAGYHGLLTLSGISPYPLEQKYYKSFLKRIFEYGTKTFLVREGDWIIYGDSALMNDSIRTERVNDVFINDTSVIAVCENSLIDLRGSPVQIITGAEYFSGFCDFAAGDSSAYIMLHDGAVVELENYGTYLKTPSFNISSAPLKKKRKDGYFDISGREVSPDDMQSGIYMRSSDGELEKILIIK